MLSTRVAVCFMCIFLHSSAVYSEKVEPAFVKLSSLGTNTCHLPNELSVTISTKEIVQTLTLKSAQLPEEDTPVYTVKRDGKEEESTLDKEEQNSLQESGYYVDQSGSTSVEVVCTVHRQQPRIEMKGHVVFSNGNFYDLEPDMGTRMDSGHEPGDVSYLLLPRERGHAESHIPGKEQQAAQGVTRRTSRRHKRDTDDIYIDTVVLVGNSEYQRWLGRTAATNTTLKRLEAINNIRQYFALLFNSVKQRFTSASPRYNIKLVGVVIEDARESEWVTRVREIQGNDTRLDGQLMLDAIWNWTRNATDFPQNDVIVTFESLSLYSSQENNFPPDFSYNSTICREDAKHVILITVSDVVALDMLYTTHGLGHALGAEDDGPPNNCSSEDHYIMARDYTKFHQLGTNNPYYFSNCSLQSMDQYIDTLIGTSSWSRSCFLETLPDIAAPNVTDVMPGEVYDPDEQCRLLYGVQSYYCFNDAGLSHRDICKRMACYGPSQDQCLYSYAAEGTTCGNKKWCQHGECVSASAAPATDDECIHGDQTGVNCAVVPNFPYYCYYSNVELLCCQSCKVIRGSDEGCQFGDNEYAEPSCQYSSCNTTSDSNFVDNCCNTCRDFRPTTTVTMTTELLTTTSSEPTTTTETTIETAVSAMTTTSAPAASTIMTTTLAATTLMTTPAATIKTTTTPAATTITTSTPAATTMMTTTQAATTRMTTPTTTASTIATTTSAAAARTTTMTTPPDTTITTKTPAATTMMITPTTKAITMMTTTTPIATTMMTTPTTAATTMMTTTLAGTTMTTTPAATTVMTTTPAGTTMTTTPAATTVMTTTPAGTTTTITPAATTMMTMASTPLSATMTTAQATTTRLTTPAVTTTPTTTTPTATTTMTTTTTASTTITTTTQTATNVMTTTTAATAMKSTTTQAATTTTTSTTSSPDPEYDQSTIVDDITTPLTTETSSLLPPSAATKDGPEKSFATSSLSPEKTTLENTFSNLPSTSGEMKMAIGLGVGLGVVGLIVVGVAVYRLCLVGRANSAAISTPEWTSLTRI